MRRRPCRSLKGSPVGNACFEVAERSAWSLRSAVPGVAASTLAWRPALRRWARIDTWLRLRSKPSRVFIRARISRACFTPRIHAGLSASAGEPPRRCGKFS